MFLLRKFGKLLRGNATPFQIISATVLGGILGFSAPPDVAPGIYLVFFILVLVLNCNLLLFAVSSALAYVVSLVLTPLSLNIGKLLLAGPSEALFAGLINAPIAAWFGWEYYVFAGGLPLAILFGVFLGMAIDRVLHDYRVKMANLEDNSERFQILTNNAFFKLVTFIFIGGFKDKKSFQQLAEESRKSLPIRITGALVVILIIPTIWAALNMFDTSFYTTRVRDLMTEANQATVDLDTMQVDYAQGRVSLIGLAASDPGDLSKNRFSAEEITADLSFSDLLAKRIVVDEITIDNARINNDRLLQGREYVPEVEIAEETPIPENSDTAPPIEISSEEIAKTYEAYQEPLSKVKEWLDDRMAKAEETRKETESQEPTVETVSWQERLEQQIEESGMRGAIAEHLIAKSPRLTVKSITVRDLRITGADLGIIDIQADWISDAPELQINPPELTISNRSQQIHASFKAESLVDPSLTSPIELRASDFAIDTVRDLLPKEIAQTVTSGKFSLQGQGTWSPAGLQLPIQAQLNQLEVQIPQLGAQTIDSIALSGNISGPIDGLSFRLNTQQLQAQLQKAATDAVQNAAKDRLSEELQKRLGSDDGEEENGGVQNLLRGLLNR